MFPSVRNVILAALCGIAGVYPCAASAKPAYVDITWLSITNIHYEIGSLGILTDGYITRIPSTNFYGGGGGLKSTHTASKPDVVAVTRVMNAMGGPTKFNILLTGHSHFDHAFDTATWATLTGARIIGSKTTCFQAQAQGITADRCTVVNGGEKLALSPEVTVRVMRWNHSGDSKTNPEQHNPVELNAAPVPDPATGGLRAGVAEDFPNGGGGRAYLFTVDGANGPFSWFYQNSASATDLNSPIIVDGINYGAPLANLKAAMSDAGLTKVDLWIGSGGTSIAQLVVPVIKPKAYIPVHWDSFTSPFLSGVTKPFRDPALASYLKTAGTKLVAPVNYMDKWRLDGRGIQVVSNTAVKHALGFTR